MGHFKYELKFPENQFQGIVITARLTNVNCFFLCIFVIFQIASLNKLENENQEAAKKLEQAIRKGGTRDMGGKRGY